MSDADLIRDLVRAMPPWSEEVWRALGYDADSPSWTSNDVPPLEVRRQACSALLARLRASVGERDPDLLGRLEEPPGPLCLGCDELLGAEGWDHSGCEEEGQERMEMWRRAEVSGGRA